MKKVSLLLAVLLILIPCTLCLSVSAESQFVGGACGISATWVYEIDSKTLTVSGSGEMEGYPAADYTDQIQKIVIEDGITNVSNSAFSDCTNLTQVELPGSITVIEYGAFLDCSSLTQIRIPGSVTEIEGGAFFGCSALTKITFCGTEAQWNAVTKGTSWDYGTGNYTVSYHTSHSWGNETIVKQPTCVNGTKNYTCTVCGETKMEYVSPVSDHTYATWTSYSKTKHQGICSCGHVQYEEHVFDSAEDDSCNLCNFLKSESSQNGNINHQTPFDHKYDSYTVYNEQYHKKACACGYAQSEKHVYSSDDDTTCDLCGYKKDGGNGADSNTQKSAKSGCKSTLAPTILSLLLPLTVSSLTIRKRKEF